MRRLVLAAVCGTLVLAACSDQNPTEPTLPEPEQSFTSCRPPHHFPIVQVSALIPKVFPKGKLQLEAAARVAATALLWETCKPSLAQRSAVQLVNFMNANTSKLIGTQTQRNTFISLVLNGVDIPFTTPPGGTGDFGVGFFDPANTNNTVVVTQNGTALVELEPGSFNQPTTIVVSRKSDGFTLTNFDGNQFPPYFDYDAINAAGDHVLKNGKLAIVAFCLLDPVYTYPENPRIGHNPVAGAPGFPFEVLEEVNLAADHPDLAAQLNCGNLAPNTVIIGGFGRGLPGLANAVWRNTKYYLGPIAETVLLPEALYASTVGTLPPPAGRAASLSPFGIVEFSEGELSLLDEPSNNPNEENFFVGSTIHPCGDGCTDIRVEMLDGETPVGAGTVVTASLIVVNAPAGSVPALSGDPTQPIGSPLTYAAFNDLRIDQPGQYQLKFEAPGATPVISQTFNVYKLEFTLQPTAAPEGTVLEGALLGESDDAFANPVVRVSILDYLGTPVTGASDEITIILPIDPLVLQGDAIINAVDGVANFTTIDGSPILQTGLSAFISDENKCVPPPTTRGGTLVARAHDGNQIQSTAFNVTPFCIL